MRHHNLLSRAPMMGPLSSGKIWAAHGAYGGGFDFYVDSVSGSDANDGTSADAAFETIGAAYTASASGDTIGLKAGQYHARRTSISHANRSFAKYGSDSDPIFDARKHLQSAAWTLESGNVWKTTVILDEASTPAGTASNTFNPAMWFEEEFLTWHVTGADIAANIASVEADPGSFTMHKDGSTVKDPRSDTAGTVYVVYVHLGDSSDPNGQDVSFTSWGAVCSLQGGTHTGIIFKGAHKKDQAGVDSYSGVIPTFQNCQSLDFGEHGWVGPLNTTDCTFSGKARPGAGLLGRSKGGALNLYTSTHRTGEQLNHANLTVANAANGLYGHGTSTNQGYDAVNLTGTFTVENVTNAIQFDILNTTNRTAFLPSLYCTATLAVSNIDNFATVDGNYSFSGGGVIAFGTSVAAGSAQTLAIFTGTAPRLVLGNAAAPTSINFGLTFVAFSTRYNLGIRNSDASHTAPILKLINVQDITSDVRMKGKLPVTGGITHEISLVLTDGTTLGDIMTSAAGTNYPAAIYVGDGCTFGMGDRTGPNIETALAGAGLVEDEAQALAGVEGFYFIDGQTTIVDRAGTVLSSPGWK